MTVNRYFFNYRNTDFVIFAKDIPEAFEPYKRMLYHKAGNQEDFEKCLLKDDPDIRNCRILCGRSVSREMLAGLLKPYQKPLIYETKIQITKEIKESFKAEDEATVISIQEVIEVPVLESVVKRGRGRPKGSKNKTKDIDSFFE